MRGVGVGELEPQPEHKPEMMTINMTGDRHLLNRVHSADLWHLYWSVAAWRWASVNAAFLPAATSVT
jgi:hypothetical protein